MSTADSTVQQPANAKEKAAKEKAKKAKKAAEVEGQTHINM
jgi:hypothetical protein